MSVNILYCEGVANSPDVRIISAIVPPGCVVRPIGSKQGLAQRILGAQDVRTGSTVAGLRDRDFDDVEYLELYGFQLPRHIIHQGYRTKTNGQFFRRF